MSIYQSFLWPFLVTSAWGFIQGMSVCVSEMVNPVFDKNERWMTLCCWGIVIIWPVGVACLTLSYT